MVLDQFKHGMLYVICVAKHLGRGVYIEKCPVKFAMRTTMLDRPVFCILRYTGWSMVGE
jgi:hypothetical protein